MSRKFWFSRSRQETGFTLLELIIVLVVLAALAALVVPLLGWVREQANYATAAAGAAEVLNNLETYRASTGNYPDRFDSLIEGQQLWAGSGLASLFRLSTPAEAGNISYFMTNSGGVGSVVNHVTTATGDPNNSTATSPIFAISSTEGVVDANGDPVINPTTGTQQMQSASRFALVNPSSPLFATAPRIIRAAYPNQANAASPQIPADHFLVAVGIGERTSSVGTTMSSAPTWGGAKANTYARYIAYFDCWAGGSGRGKVQLKLVTDSTGTTIARATELYKKAQPTDDVAAASGS